MEITYTSHKATRPERQRLRAIGVIERYQGNGCYHVPSAVRRRFAEEWQRMGLNYDDVEYFYDALYDELERLNSYEE